MYQLYYSPGACSLAIHALLHELGQKMELINTSISEGKNRSPEFLKINPRGAVPVLVDDGFIIREEAAIILYLLEKHPSSLLPASGKERAAALEWMMFCNATLHPTYAKGFWLMKVKADKAAKEDLMKATVAHINKLWSEVDARLSGQEYIAGSTLTPADLLLTVFANWNGYFQGIEIGENTKRMIKAVSSRPAFKEALAMEKVDYKAAA